MFYNIVCSNTNWDVIISPSLRLLLKVWLWCSCQNRIEEYYRHDGEQLTFYKNVIHIKTGIPEKWDRDSGVGPRTLGWHPRVGPWGGTQEWDSHICFYNILNHIVFFIRHQKALIWTIFSIFKENEVNTCFS